MKKSAIIGIVVIIAVIAGIVWMGNKPVQSPAAGSVVSETPGTETAIVTETTKVSDKLSEYQNAELGFSVKYPSMWEKEDANSGVNFIVPIDKGQVSTVASLQATIQVTSSCTFPPVTSGVKDKGTIKSGDLTFNTISMANTVQGRTYTNRMYSLQKDSICYMFSFAAIALDPAAKKLTGSQATQAQNNNKALVADADAAFTAMVKSFAFVTGPQGKDETQASPVKK